MMDSYNSLFIFCGLVVMYGISWALSRFKVISLMTHRRVWNVLLALFFLATATLGLLMAFSLDYKFSMTWYRDILWYHVELGISMVVISLFHLLWHWKYYIQIIKKLFNHDKKKN